MTGPTIESLASILRGRQGELAKPSGDGLELLQVGAAVLGEPFPVPVPEPGDPVLPRGGEPTIETFVVEPGRSVEGTGGDETVTRWWRPTVEAMVARVMAALGPVDVELGGPLYVTASATALDEVIAEPHLDDDQYDPEAGVGLVAIAASHRGPRLAQGVLSGPPARAGAPLGLDQRDLEAWFDDGPTTGGPSRVQATEADRLVLFPRFGQLHAGPTLAGDAAAGASVRNLLVLRADTVPG